MCSFSNAWKLNREGMAACNEGDFDKAEDSLLEAIRLASCKSRKIHRATMFNNLSVIYQMSGRINDAVQAYSSAISYLNPEHKGQAALIARMKGKLESLKDIAA
ncbi:hypothetical protein SAMN05660337_3459 [Maridesulfovibrio ferrireducens]|uniref:Tetratricopeptide repeat-containing protein n=1 Tax=Maridesulfovibrio ferrireducens TaxID=246191 RepID=A0A1G9LNF7_9BACT|nr:tetratricopeptide repeat protein [Maridesulfovibrio ferrireducens]SDL63374.1 hypothetical protein SAMN05660337_3459 [Maridesulfovibrio ferrireducens]